MNRNIYHSVIFSSDLYLNFQYIDALKKKSPLHPSQEFLVLTNSPVLEGIYLSHFNIHQILQNIQCQIYRLNIRSIIQEFSDGLLNRIKYCVRNHHFHDLNKINNRFFK